MSDDAPDDEQLPPAEADADGAVPEQPEGDQSAAAMDSTDATVESGAEAISEAVAEATGEEAAEATSEAPVDSISERVAPEALLVEDLGLIERKSAVDTSAEGQAEAEPPPDATDLPPAELRAVVEGLLFVSTKPLSAQRLAGCLPGTSPAYLNGFLTGLAARFEHERRGWELRREANGWRLMTRATFYPWVRQLERKELPTKLSKGALETLSVVAYKQPVARGAIEDIRGVQCGPVLRQLMDLKLVAVIGRDDHALGRPLLYGTTDHFLTRFGLGSPADLPKKHEFGD